MSSPTVSIQPTISISNPPSPGSEEAAVLAVVEALLDAVPSKDSAKLLSYCHPSCSAARMRGPELLIETLEKVCAGIGAMEGELWEGFVEPDVKVYNDLAMVWSRNEIKVDGKLVAVGCNVISLHKMGAEGWKITGIADTAHPPPAATTTGE